MDSRSRRTIVRCRSRASETIHEVIEEEGDKKSGSSGTSTSARVYERTRARSKAKEVK